MYFYIGRTVPLHIAVKASDRRGHGAAASVAYTVKNFGNVKPVSLVFLQLIRYNLALSQILEHGNVVMHFYACENVAAVNAVPFADVKRLAVGTAPFELLGCEAVQIGMLRYRRQSIAEAEAIGQKNVLASDTEFFFIVIVSEKEISEKSLG